MAAATLWCLVAICCAVVTSNASPTQNPENTRGRQLLYYAPQQVQPQRLVSSLESNAASQFYSPNQLKQDVQTFSLTSEDKGRGEKLETLEPDAELLPGAQQPQNPTAQVPVSPAAGIPRLLPGQQVYIVHPQHQVYMNALYPGLTNGFRPNVQIPGYQRFFIVPQATAGDGSIAGPGSYQSTILVDASGQPVAPQYFQPNYQRFVAPSLFRPEPQNVTPEKSEPSNPDPSKYQESAKNTVGGSLRDDNPGAIINGNREPPRVAEPANFGPNRIGENIRPKYQGSYQQTANYIGAQPQFGYAAQQNAFPFYDFRQPFHQGQTGDFQNNSNGVQYAQGAQPSLFSAGQYQGGQFPTGQLPPGFYQSGPFPTAQFPVGQFQPGQFQAGQSPAGQFGPGQFPAGQFGPGQFPVGQFGPGQFPAGQFPAAQFPAAQFPAGQYPGAPGAPGASPAPSPQAPPHEAQGRNDYGYDDIGDDVSTEANNNVEETSSKDGEKAEPAPQEAKEEISKETIEATSTTESAEDYKKSDR